MGLLLKIGIDSSAYKAGLSEMKKDTQKMANGLTSIMGGAIAGIGFGGLIVGLKKAGDAAAELNKQAELFKTTTQSIERMTFVAEKNRATFDNVADAIHDATEKAQDAAAGNDGFAESFKNMGLTAEEFLRLDFEGKLMALSDGFILAEEKGLGFLAANELLGGAAQELIPLLRLGSEAIAEQGENASVTSDKMINAGLATKSAFSSIGNAIKNVALTIGDALFEAGDAIIGLAQDFDDYLTASINAAWHATLDLLGALKDLVSFDFEGFKEGIKKATTRGKEQFPAVRERVSERRANFALTRQKAKQGPEVESQNRKSAREEMVEQMKKARGKKDAEAAKGTITKAWESMKKTWEEVKKAEKKKQDERRKLFSKSKERTILDLQKIQEEQKGNVDSLKGKEGALGGNMIADSLQSIGGGSGSIFTVQDPILNEARRQTALLQAIKDLQGTETAIKQTTEVNAQ